MVSHQTLGRCAKQEMDMADCLEAYGLIRGRRKCQMLIEDFAECQTLKKQFNRFILLRRERERQIASGKLTGEKQYVSPKVDSY
ncbi:hypothetical protein O3G_MSEX008878 [Manduca sexta]|uniref:Complex I-15 kDa n=2 Tax=Manduca sexta TaxID=7130 RepID=A0A921ZBI4_MANSE|nr:hypothetical protein O3G_MSEX008878 [Manduca sexta]